MAIKRRMNYFSGMRVDIPHLRSLESSTSADIDDVLRGVVTGLNQPYLVRGFKINIPDSSIPATSLTLKVSDSAILHSSSSESGTVLTVPAGTPDLTLDSSVDSTHVIGSFVNNATNYVALDYVRRTDTGTVDAVAGWSPSQQLEFQRTAPLGRILDYRIIITTTGFGNNLPLYIIKTNASGNVTFITKAASGLFRLGKGGAVPNPSYKWTYKDLSNPQTNTVREWVYNGSENPQTVTPGDDKLAFDYGDWSITSLKEWMDAVMSRFKDVTGSNYWYLDSQLLTSPPSVFNTWFDSVGSVLTGAGTISYNLLLEATFPTSGEFHPFTTSTIDPFYQNGDSYVLGTTSGAKATVQSLNGSELLVNSQTQNFIYDEPLQNRRVLRYSSASMELRGDLLDSVRFARFARKATSDDPGYSAKTISSSVAQGRLITCTTSTAHGLQPGDLVRIAGISTVNNTANGIQRVNNCPTSTSFSFQTVDSQTGSLGSGTVTKDLNQSGLPFLPRFQITAFSVSGGNVYITAPKHNISAPPASQTGTTSSGSKVITALSDTSVLAVGMRVSGTGIPSESQIEEILSSSSVRITQQATANGSPTLTFDNIITVTGLSATSNAPNGRFAVVGLSPQNEIIITPSVVPTGTFSVSSSSFVSPAVYSFLATISRATPDIYNLIDVNCEAWSATAFRYTLGSSTLAAQTQATGPIQIDGVVADSTVANPSRVAMIRSVNPGTDILVMTHNRHRLSTLTGADYTIYGDPTLSDFITSYTNINLNPLSQIITAASRTGNTVSITVADTTPLQNGDYVLIEENPESTFNGLFQISSVSPTGFEYTTIASGSVSNSGGYAGRNCFVINKSGGGLPSTTPWPASPPNLLDVFARYPNNPYAGPLQWSSDIVDKGIIGDISYTIPVTATATGTADANKFNINGVTGTVYLNSGEVAYVELERNQSVSNGVSFNTIGGANPIIGSIAPLRIDSTPLAAGDFVKFEDEDETKWLKVSSVSGVTIYLVTDSGLPPTLAQRPAKQGRLVYSKGIYDTVQVAPHWKVPSSSDVYWLAVRRDNGGLPKAYLKGLELEQGEIRQITDNTTDNLLLYTGAMNEGAINPNYTAADSSGDYQATQALSVTDVDANTRTVTFDDGPALGFQRGDRIKVVVGSVTHNYTISFLYTSRTVRLAEDVSAITPGAAATYYRLNYNIQDTDNLTIAMRKEDRELARFNTALTKPVYDESCYVQMIPTSGTGAIKSGSYIYTGPSQAAPTALAYVIHGNQNVSETIEGQSVNMPGGHLSFIPAWSNTTIYVPGNVVKVGSTVYRCISLNINQTPPNPTYWAVTTQMNSVIVQIVSGTFNHGDALYQNGVNTGVSVNTALYGITSPTIASTVELVLPPNRRTQTVSGGVYTAFPSPAVYKAALGTPELRGEDLIVIANDQIREAGVDYDETFGGPKGKIQILRPLPPNTRIRFRTMATFGSALASVAGNVTLQQAYNAGRLISTNPSSPVEIGSQAQNVGDTALKVKGSLEIDGSDGSISPTNFPGGVYGPTGTDGYFNIGKEGNKPLSVWTKELAVKTTANFPGSARHVITCGQVTTNATVTLMTGSNIAMPASSAIVFKATLVARDQTDAGSTMLEIECGFKRDSGSPSLVGSAISKIIGAEGTCLGFYAYADISGNDIVIRVVGMPGIVAVWTATIEYQIVTTST